MSLLLAELVGYDLHPESVASVLASLYEAAHREIYTGEEWEVAISLNKSDYNGFPSLGYKHLSYGRIQKALRALEDEKIIFRYNGHFDRATGKGRLTRICLTARGKALLKLDYLGFPGSERNIDTLWDNLNRDCYGNLPTIIKTPSVLVRDKNKQLTIPKQKTKFLQLVKQTERINTSLSDYKFGLGGRVCPLLIQKLSSAGDFRSTGELRTGNHIVQLTRIFNDGKLNKGGRFYTPIQQLKKAERKQLLIDGSETCELDYKGLHMNILYHRLGEEGPYDPYAHDFISRAAFKKASLIAINSNSRKQAKYALNSAAPGLGSRGPRCSRRWQNPPSASVASGRPSSGRAGNQAPRPMAA